MTWFCEQLYASARQTFEIGKHIYRGESEFQTIEVFENPYLGRVLVLDGIVQTTERDEYIYHEMLSHVPVLAHGGVANVLLIGGGDGGMLEELLKHPVKRVTMVEIDATVVEVCREHLASISSGAFDDPRTRLIIGDGTAFVAETQERFELVVIDSTDPVGPSVMLFERRFFENCRRVLSPNGIVVSQNGVPFFQADELLNCHRLFSTLFAHSGFFVAPVPTYYGGFMAFGWGSVGLDMSDPDLAAIAARYAGAGLSTRYYNPEIHRAAFALPNDIRELLS